MTGLVRKATLLTACGLLIGGAAMASVPSAANSDLGDCDNNVATTDPCINVVGGTTPLGVSAGPDPAGQLSITIRDFSNLAMPGIPVRIDFSGCTDVKICQSTNGVLGQVVDCVLNFVENTTDGSGIALFNIYGGGSNLGNSPGAQFPCAQVFADGTPMGALTAIVFDQDGVLSGGNGMDGADISAALTDLNSGNYYGRSDYSPDGAIDGVDISEALTYLNLGASSVGCPASPGYCP